MENIQQEIEQQGETLQKEIEQTATTETTPIANTGKLNKGIGTKEQDKLGAAKVQILEPRIEPVTVKNKQSEIVECMVKHPSKEDLIKVSQVKYVKNNKIEQSGLWYHEDEDQLIVKNSALAVFLRHVGVGNISELTGKTLLVEPGRDGYLAFKAY